MTKRTLSPIEKQHLIEKFKQLSAKDGFVPVEQLITELKNTEEKSFLDFCDQLLSNNITVKLSSKDPILTSEEIFDLKQTEDEFLIVEQTKSDVSSGGYKVMEREEEIELALSMKDYFNKALLSALKFKSFENTLQKILNNIIYTNDKIWKYFEDPRNDGSGETETGDIMEQIVNFKSFLQKKGEKLELLYSDLLDELSSARPDKKNIFNIERRIKRAHERRLEFFFEKLNYNPRIEFLDLLSFEITKHFNQQPHGNDEFYLKKFGVYKDKFFEIAKEFVKNENMFHQTREKLILSNQKLVIFFARKYKDQGVELADLIGEGNIGLLRAVERFDPEKGSRLATYATWWIKHNLNRAVSNQGSTIRIPGHIREEKNRILKVKKELTLKNGTVPSNAEIAEYLGLPAKKVSAILQNTQSTISFDKPIGSEDEDDTLQKLIPDVTVETPEEEVSKSKNSHILNRLMSGLSTRERHILEMRYGLLDYNPMTLQEVGEKLSITRERVRQLQTKAELKLLKMAKKEGFTINP